MKKILFLTILFLFSLNYGFSQIYKGERASSIIEGSELIRFKEFSEIPVFIRFRESVNMDVEQSINFTKQITKNENFDLKLQNIQNNQGNQKTYRYVQTINNIPIEFSSWSVQTEDDRVYAMNGEILSNPEVNIDFSITEEQALEIALNYIDADIYMWENEESERLLKSFLNNSVASYFPVAEKVIAPSDIVFEKSTLHTAYKFNIYSKIPHDRKYVYVDAQSGEVLYDLQILMSNNVEAIGNTVYSGERTIMTHYLEDEEMYRLRDFTRGNGVATFNCHNTADFSAATDFWNEDTYWNNINEQLNQYATDAHFATASTYDYFLEIHGRNSIDDDGHQLRSFIHFNLVEAGMQSNINAFWNGQWMTYGDGNPDSGITPLTTIDICAHEITHGLTSHTAKLIYKDESGALNEAFSDIFGTAVEFYAVPEFADWTIGEDIGFYMRSLENPKIRNNPDTYKGEFWYFGEENNGGVHTNNGPLCYWFYLISDGGSGTNDNGDSYSVNPIGIEKAEQIAFRMLTVYLSPSSNYKDAWFYGMQAAADLYGACSPEVQEVGNAFYAIGVAEPYINEVHAAFDIEFEGLENNCQPPSEIRFINNSYNGFEFIWDFGDGNTSTDINPVHIYNDFGEFDVTLTIDGGGCGENSIVKESLITINPDLTCVHLMPQSGNIIIDACSGTIYDHGGPDYNYHNNKNSTITLHSEDAENYILYINHFDIEPGSAHICNYDYLAFYDGTSTSDELINNTRYCNTTGNPEIIYSSGNAITIQFLTDQATNLSGFEIEYNCLTVEDLPLALFSYEKSYTCDGLISFLENSLNNPMEWLWDFGDGNISEEQNPAHIYSENGTYSVSLTVTNNNGNNTKTKNNIITVDLPNTPVITEDDFYGCNDESFTIDIDFEGELYWYENINDIEAVHIGNSWLHDPIDTDVQYYIREKVPGENYMVGPTNNTEGGGFFGNVDHVHYLIFDAYKDFRINTVKVNAENNGVRTIALRDNNSKIIQQKTLFIYEGESEIELNIDVSAGEDLQLVGMGAPNLFRTNDASYLDYPYTIDNIVSIKHSSASTGTTGHYYYFYDWDITTIDCISAPADIAITSNICSNIIKNKNKQNISIYPNPSNGIIEITGLTADKEYLINITDISGKILLQNNLFDRTTLNLSSFSKGVYFVSISGDEFIQTYKLILQ